MQIAKAFGLKVIGTASKMDETILVKAGIDRLIDYKTEKFEEILKKGEADFVFDPAGGESLKKSFLIQPKKIIFCI